MSKGDRKLVATDKSAVVAKPMFDAIGMKGSQGDGCLANAAGTDESDRNEVLCEINNLLDEIVASEKDPRRLRRRFSVYAGCRCQMIGPLVVYIADLC